LFGFCPDSIGEVTVKSETAFQLAVKYNQFDVFKVMVDLSKNMRNIKDILNAGDEDGNTVLHLAIARKQSQVNNAIFHSYSTPCCF
jgi:ankyrin repeat protein